MIGTSRCHAHTVERWKVFLKAQSGVHDNLFIAHSLSCPVLPWSGLSGPTWLACAALFCSVIHVLSCLSLLSCPLLSCLHVLLQLCNVMFCRVRTVGSCPVPSVAVFIFCPALSVTICPAPSVMSGSVLPCHHFLPYFCPLFYPVRCCSLMFCSVLSCPVLSCRGLYCSANNPVGFQVSCRFWTKNVWFRVEQI
jgi:hypothetical protein